MWYLGQLHPEGIRSRKDKSSPWGLCTKNTERAWKFFFVWSHRGLHSQCWKSKCSSQQFEWWRRPAYSLKQSIRQMLGRGRRTGIKKYRQRSQNSRQAVKLKHVSNADHPRQESFGWHPMDRWRMAGSGVKSKKKTHARVLHWNRVQKATVSAIKNKK